MCSFFSCCRVHLLVLCTYVLCVWTMSCTFDGNYEMILAKYSHFVPSSLYPIRAACAHPLPFPPHIYVSLCVPLPTSYSTLSNTWYLVWKNPWLTIKKAPVVWTGFWKKNERLVHGTGQQRRTAHRRTLKDHPYAHYNGRVVAWHTVWRKRKKLVTGAIHQAQPFDTRSSRRVVFFLR